MAAEANSRSILHANPRLWRTSTIPASYCVAAGRRPTLAAAANPRARCPLQPGEMLGEFLSRVLLLLFGYAMPAFECFKTVEARPNDAHMLRFWCQYWMPMYGEIKLAFFVYLWYPKTKGSDIVYDTFLRPMVMHSLISDLFNLLHVRQRNKKSSGWGPFATKRRPPSPPRQESIFGGPADLDAAAVAQVIRASMAGAKPARRQYSGKY
ncbi:hypothetical protein TRIUR3_22539 [Triticum urartu]|uniref:HVA22-like protein n=1 Tax=Triticum urartu TaxID=4572 RepID=M7ZBH8_TRIUA|nr:hypothetical protein TRIUR3_22539 [Triticum urartu]